MVLPVTIGEKLQALKGASADWSALPDQDRATVARACRQQLASIPVGWIDADLKVLGLDPAQGSWYNTRAFDPFLFTSTVARWLDGIADKLEGGRPIPEPTRAVKGGAVYAMGALDANGTPGADLEVWTDDKLAADPAPKGGVCLVLGAGNHNFLTFCDVLERLFLQKEAVFLKHHPLRPHMAKPFAHLLEPAMAMGAFDHCLDTDIDGAHSALLQAPAVTHVHFTGSEKTHQKVANVIKTGVGLTAELGNVTPWIICPGAWTDATVKFHARMLALSFKSSCSMLCLAPKVLVLPTEEAMPERALFLERLKAELAELPQLPPYYPGAHSRYQAFKAQYPQGEEFEAPPAQKAAPTEAVYENLGQDLHPLPSLLVDVGTLGKHSRYATDTEAFAPVLAVATVDASAADYCVKAAEAVNAHLMGSLTCNVVYPPLVKLAERDEALDAMLQKLEYGSVSVNLWSALQYANPLGVWGAAPGKYSRTKPGSGNGFVGNVGGIPKVSKSVTVAPFFHAKSLKEPMPSGLAHFLFALITGKWSYLLPSRLNIFCRGD